MKLSDTAKAAACCLSAGWAAVAGTGCTGGELAGTGPPSDANAARLGTSTFDLVVVDFQACADPTLLPVFSVPAAEKPVSKETVRRAELSASKLRAGMPEEEADAILRADGLSSSISIGCSCGWSKSYPLAEGADLVLEVEPMRFVASGAWTDGIVVSAQVMSGTNVLADVELKGGPERTP